MNDTNDFDIYSSNTMLSVIVFDCNTIKVFNLATGDSQWTLEMRILEYYIKEITCFNCDGDVGLIQIVGGNTQDGDFKLITYRISGSERPT